MAGCSRGQWTRHRNPQSPGATAVAAAPLTAFVASSPADRTAAKYGEWFEHTAEPALMYLVYPAELGALGFGSPAPVLFRRAVLKACMCGTCHATSLLPSGGDLLDFPIRSTHLRLVHAVRDRTTTT